MVDRTCVRYNLQPSSTTRQQRRNNTSLARSKPINSRPSTWIKTVVSYITLLKWSPIKLGISARKWILSLSQRKRTRSCRITTITPRRVGPASKHKICATTTKDREQETSVSAKQVICTVLSYLWTFCIMCSTFIFFNHITLMNLTTNLPTNFPTDHSLFLFQMTWAAQVATLGPMAQFNLRPNSRLDPTRAQELCPPSTLPTVASTDAPWASSGGLVTPCRAIWL